jgi:fumarylacetoacetate (FAA) hydrolase family protein
LCCAQQRKRWSKTEMNLFEKRVRDTTAVPTSGTFVGRVRSSEGPCVVKLEHGQVIDITKSYPTMRDLCETSDPSNAAHKASGKTLCSVAELLASTASGKGLRLLAPIDLQSVKAAGVTFAVSMLERVIEEKARGNPALAVELRAQIHHLIGDDLSKLKPGSPEAIALKQVLIEKGAWSQYLEVGIGPDAEIFTKAPVMAAVGHGAEAGLNKISTWNNPEPEVVVVVASDGRIIGAMLGNDVNLRDVEGRSALLLGKAKDNNASCALGPFMRLFDDSFSLDHVRRMELTLTVEAEDGYELQGGSNMSKISRDPADLVAQMLGPHHQYPDGAVLFLGTLFAPTADRGHKGQGFTHKIGDVVTVASPELGKLVNRMVYSNDAAPWTFGTSHLMRNLAKRGLL